MAHARSCLGLLKLSGLGMIVGYLGSFPHPVTVLIGGLIKGLL